MKFLQIVTYLVILTSCKVKKEITLETTTRTRIPATYKNIRKWRNDLEYLKDSSRIRLIHSEERYTKNGADSYRELKYKIEIESIEKLCLDSIYEIPNPSIKVFTSIYSIWRPIDGFDTTGITGQIKFKRIGRRSVVADIKILDRANVFMEGLEKFN